MARAPKMDPPIALPAAGGKTVRAIDSVNENAMTIARSARIAGIFRVSQVGDEEIRPITSRT